MVPRNDAKTLPQMVRRHSTTFETGGSSQQTRFSSPGFCRTLRRCNPCAPRAASPPSPGANGAPLALARPPIGALRVARGPRRLPCTRRRFRRRRAQRICTRVQLCLRRFAADARGPRSGRWAHDAAARSWCARLTCDCTFDLASDVRCRDGIAAAPGVTLRLTGAAIWHPVPPPPRAIRDAIGCQPAVRGRRVGAPPPYAFECHRSRGERRARRARRSVPRPRRRYRSARGRAADRLGRGSDAGGRRRSRRLARGARCARRRRAGPGGLPARAVRPRSSRGAPGRRRSPRIACASPRGATTTPM